MDRHGQERLNTSSKCALHRVVIVCENFLNFHLTPKRNFFVNGRSPWMTISKFRYETLNTVDRCKCVCKVFYFLIHARTMPYIQRCGCLCPCSGSILLPVQPSSRGRVREAHYKPIWSRCVLWTWDQDVLEGSRYDLIRRKRKGRKDCLFLYSIRLLFPHQIKYLYFHLYFIFFNVCVLYENMLFIPRYHDLQRRSFSADALYIVDIGPSPELPSLLLNADCKHFQITTSVWFPRGESVVLPQLNHKGCLGRHGARCCCRTGRARVVDVRHLQLQTQDMKAETYNIRRPFDVLRHANYLLPEDGVAVTYTAKHQTGRQGSCQLRYCCGACNACSGVRKEDRSSFT